MRLTIVVHVSLLMTMLILESLLGDLDVSLSLQFWARVFKFVLCLKQSFETSFVGMGYL